MATPNYQQNFSVGIKRISGSVSQTKYDEYVRGDHNVDYRSYIV